MSELPVLSQLSSTNKILKRDIDKDGYIRSRKDNFGNPIMYYLGINDMNASQQGIEMLSYDIKKLIDE